MSNAQKILVAIGGTAELVAGHMDHYFAGAQTPKRTKRVSAGKHAFSRGIQAKFDEKNATPARLAAHKAHLAHMQGRRDDRMLAKLGVIGDDLPFSD